MISFILGFCAKFPSCHAVHISHPVHPPFIWS